MFALSGRPEVAGATPSTSQAPERHQLFTDRVCRQLRLKKRRMKRFSHWEQPDTQNQLLRVHKHRIRFRLFLCCHLTQQADDTNRYDTFIFISVLMQRNNNIITNVGFWQKKTDFWSRIFWWFSGFVLLWFHVSNVHTIIVSPAFPCLVSTLYYSAKYFS